MYVHGAHQVYFLHALMIRNAKLSMIIKKDLTAVRVTPMQNSME